jgi:L-alanine-DL-glutamate epimerase-like enolase superfamily enzyme
MRIASTDCTFFQEPLRAPLGFKGGAVTALWQVVALLRDELGNEGVGVGVQSPLWSDAAVAGANSEAAANALMFQMTGQALALARDVAFATPFELLDRLLPEVHAHGRRLCGRDDLRLTFTLNALVPVDNAAWMLYARRAGKTGFDALLPAEFRAPLAVRHSRLGCVPLISYGVGGREIVRLADAGCFCAKIKVGSDPEGDGDPDKMLDWDCRRLTEIHGLLRDRRTPWTASGHILYYLDANGRYDSRERLMELLEHAERIGALERIVLLEEPFPEHCAIPVHDLPVRVAADESAHCERDAIRRIGLGYRAVALKPIAKTLSMSLRVARAAWESSVPCFCADLTGCPLLVDWNKVVGARLPPLPGLTIGVMESNGPQNYVNWDAMRAVHPAAGADWIDPRDGLFHLGDAFWARNGGILEMPAGYRKLLRSGIGDKRT